MNETDITVSSKLHMHSMRPIIDDNITLNYVFYTKNVDTELRT